jgi:hypothetical protein
MIVPALRNDRKNLEDVFEGKGVEKNKRNEMSSFYKEHVDNVVAWELIDNAGWYSDVIKANIHDEKSALRRKLLTRDQVESTFGLLTPRGRKIFRDFAHLLYSVSGSRVVNCESSLPPENYIDYSLQDISERQIVLSDEQVFWKLFLELAFEAMQKRPIPIELLENLSFNDIYSLRQPLSESGFRDNYDAVIKKSTALLESDLSKGVILYDAQDLLQVQESIARSFDEIFEREIPEFMKKKRIEGRNELAKNSLSLGIGLIGFIPIPIVSGVANLIGLLPSLFNLPHIFRSFRAAKDYQSYQEQKQQTLQHLIEKSELSDESAFIEVIDLLTKVLSSRITI